ncbi:MAG TPA: RdgB/HAM1 family non-canonical purine NTP pyrophosphatase [Sphingomicrobium sp.]|nr:RdgB/HAM1 family non-canonical purine NTP pyrophosphatase [Sphingomicrobium sp.]
MKAIGPRLVIATHNAGKLKEIQELLAPHGIECVSAAELGLPEPEEIGNSFIDNADLKAREAADLSGLPALSDDSGLSADALGGLPGIFSARWAEGSFDQHGLQPKFGEGFNGRNFGLAMHRLHEKLVEQGPDASWDAHFTCALSLAWPDNGQIESFEGKVFGTLVWPPRGDKGFGYDPMFVPTGYDKTFGEFDPEAKHAISHRAEAFNKLVAALG